MARQLTMTRRKLGRTPLDVPVIGMGTWQTFDTRTDRRPIVEEAIEAGITLFDSSPMYGQAEETLARAIAGRRDQVTIATKVWTPDPAAGRQQVAHALDLFGRVEIYQVHNLVNWQAHLPILEALKGEGKVIAVGATHYLSSAYDELCALMRSGRLDMVQVPYNPVRREVERQVLPLAKELGLGVLVHSPLRDGVLSRSPDAGRLQALGVETWAQAVLKWIASDERVSCVLTATKTPGRPTENAQAGRPPWFDEGQRQWIASWVRG
ncbi:MAG TPA: aldo/keto reductase [Candidatus Limnocylindrales bacterium]|nr:aldo/keto reductase [Candidatus Limnocylindrales bacterium]